MSLRAWVVFTENEDLAPAIRQAVQDMVDFLARERGMEPWVAYALLSLAGDIRVSRTLRPISPVKMHLSRGVLEQLGSIRAAPTARRA